MKLILIAAFTALCSAAKLDNTYLPPVSAKTAGGTTGLETPLVSSDDLPAGSFVNEAQGVVVDAAAAGTRASPGSEETGLGGSRTSYGSTASKVGNAAFEGPVSGQIPNTFARIAPIPEHETVVGPVHDGKVYQSKTLLPQDSKDYNSNTLSYENNVESHKYNYGFQTDNIEPTTSIEQNAKDEAAGHFDNGSYDSQKYNAEGDYADSNKYDDKHGQFVKRPESQTNGVIINQNSQSGSGFPGFGSVSTDRPQAFNTYKPGYQSTQTGHSQVFSTSSTGAQGSFGSSSFGQNTQGFQSGAPSKTQFGQTNFGSKYSTNQFGSQFAQGSKPSFSSQPGNTQFGFNQHSSTPSTQSFSQFESQNSQQTVTGFNSPSATSGSKPSLSGQETLFGKPVTSSFGSSTSSFGQSGSYNVAKKEYLPPLNAAKPTQDTFNQKPQSGVIGTPTFGSNIKPFGLNQQTSQESSATATASVSGSQTGFESLSPAVLSGFKRPSNTQTFQYYQGQSSLKPSLSTSQQSESGFATSQKTQEATFGTDTSLNQGVVSSSIATSEQPQSQSVSPQSGSKPLALSTVSQTSSSQTSQSQNIGTVGNNQKPEYTGFLFNTPKPTIGQNTQTVDNAYYYNQPGKPFGTSSPTSQGSSFLGHSTGQHNSVNGQKLPENQFSGFISNLSTQKGQVSGSNKVPSGIFAPASPTASQVGSGSYNGVTQAAVSPFPSPSPTPVTSFPQKPFTQSSSTLFGQKPQKEQSQFGQTSSSTFEENHKTSVSQNTASVPTQQYTGELYEYNKPEPVFPASFSSSTPSSLSVLNQPTQSSISQGSLSSSQFGQATLTANEPLNKPQIGFNQISQSGSQFEVQKTQQVSTQQGVKPQGFQSTQNSYKPFGSQFSGQGAKPQFGQSTQSLGSSFTQTQSSQQTVGSVANTQQSVQTQPLKPLGSTTQFGFSGSKPQIGQGSQISQVSGLQSNQQTIGSVSTTQKETTAGNQVQSGYLPPSPLSISSTLGGQGNKPQSSLGTQTSQGSTFQQSTQTTQQTLGSATQGQSSQSQFGLQSQKPFSTVSRFGTQETKPQFGQVSQTSFGSSFQQSTQQTFGSLSQQAQNSQSKFGSQTYKPFGSTQFGLQANKPQFGQIPQKSQGSLFQQTPASSTGFGSVANTQQQTSQSSLTQFGGQASKPFGTVTFSGQGTKPQLGQASQTTQGSSFTQQTTQQTFGTNTQNKPTYGSQNQFGTSSYKPFSSQTQFGSQGIKPQFGQVSQISQENSATQQTVGSVFNTQQPTKQPQNVYIPSKSSGSSVQFGIQGNKPQFGQGFLSQGNTFQQSTQTTQQTVGSTTNEQKRPVLGSFGSAGSQPSTPISVTTQLGLQETKPQGSSFVQSQSNQQSGSTFTQQQSGQESHKFGSQQSKPFQTTLQFGAQGNKPQGSSFSQTQTSQQSETTLTQQQSSQSTGTSGSESSKPFGATTQFGILGSKPQIGQAQQSYQGSSLTQTQTVNKVPSTQQQGSHVHFGSQTYKPFGAQGAKPQFGQTQTSQQSTFTQSQFNQQSSYNKFNQPKPFASSSPAPFGTTFSTQPTKTQFGTSQFGQSTTQGSSKFQTVGAQSPQIFSTSHHQESHPQFGAPAQPSLGQSTTTYAPFTNTQFGYQNKPFGNSPVSTFERYQPSIHFNQPGYPGFGGSHASSSASTYQPPFKGTQFGSQPFRPFGSSLNQPAKSQFGQAPTSFASAFASSSSGGFPEPVPGTSFTVQPFGSSPKVQPTSGPQFGQSITPTLGQKVSGTQSTSVASEIDDQKPYSSGVSQVSSVKPLAPKPDFGFSKPCCQGSQVGQSTTQATPSYGVSSTSPSLSPTSASQSPIIVEGSVQKTEEFQGPSQPQKFDEKTGYYY